jgi:hypothetical protein
LWPTVIPKDSKNTNLKDLPNHLRAANQALPLTGAAITVFPEFKPVEAAPPGELGRYCDTRSHIALLDAGETAIQPWCRVTCSHPEGALLATVGSQARRSGGEGEPHAGPMVGLMGMAKATAAFT